MGVPPLTDPQGDSFGNRRRAICDGEGGRLCRLALQLGDGFRASPELAAGAVVLSTTIRSLSLCPYARATVIFRRQT
jgi:hypothetical protein